jgi:hypothetical protein
MQACYGRLDSSSPLTIDRKRAGATDIAECEKKGVVNERNKGKKEIASNGLWLSPKVVASLA